MDRNAAPASALVLLSALLLAGLTSTPVGAQDGSTDKPTFELPEGILEIEPSPGDTIANRTPLIVVIFNPDNGPDPGIVTMRIGSIEVNEHDDYQVGESRIEYTVAEVFALVDGDNNVTIQYPGDDGSNVEFTWTINVDQTPPPKESPVTLGLVVTAILATITIATLGAVLLLLYLKKTRNFTLRKHFARNPAQRELLTLYIPLGLAGVSTLLALYWLTTLPAVPRLAHEFLVLGGLTIGLGPYAIDMQVQRTRLGAAERAYAQFLFELADALRGGIDPLKAIRELAKTETGILSLPLQIAADGIRMGTPFDQVMANMAKQLKSPLIGRYSALVAEAATIGGEVASVVHRAAKDMDEMVKITQERRRQLKAPAMTMYIAFGVLLLMVKSLMDFAPGFADTDFGGLTPGADLESGTAATAARMTLEEMRGLFFHLVMVTSTGTGLLIGSFTDGKLRYGMIHAFIMVITASLFYRFIVL